MNSLIRRRIKMSIAAIVILFLLGGMVLASSLIWFDSTLKAEPIPRSMTEEHVTRPIFDSTTWYVLLLVCAGVGLPLGMFVLQTLNECEEKIGQSDQTSR